MYRLSSDLAPYATHPDMPQFHGMVAESDAELRAIGRKARRLRYPPLLPPVAIRAPQQPGPEADGQEHLGPQLAVGDAGPDGARAGGRGRHPCRRALRRPRERAGRAGPRTGRRCRSTSAGGWCWRTTTSASARGRALDPRAHRRAADLRLPAPLVPQPGRARRAGRAPADAADAGRRACGRKSTSARRGRSCARCSGSTRRRSAARRPTCRRSGPATPTSPTRSSSPASCATPTGSSSTSCWKAKPRTSRC